MKTWLEVQECGSQKKRIKAQLEVCPPPEKENEGLAGSATVQLPEEENEGLAESARVWPLEEENEGLAGSVRVYPPPPPFTLLLR